MSDTTKKYRGRTANLPLLLLVVLLLWGAYRGYGVRRRVSGPVQEVALPGLTTFVQQLEAQYPCITGAQLWTYKEYRVYLSLAVDGADEAQAAAVWQECETYLSGPAFQAELEAAYPPLPRKQNLPRRAALSVSLQLGKPSGEWITYRGEAGYYRSDVRYAQHPDGDFPVDGYRTWEWSEQRRPPQEQAAVGTEAG